MERRGSLTFGVLLILAGGFALAVQFVPNLADWWVQFADWPFWIIGPGLIFLAAALVSGVSGLVVPGMIISGIGGILYYQNLTGDWQSWAYLWTLIIGFVGIGVFFMHLLDGEVRKAFDEGGTAIITSLVMFLIFGSLMRYIFGEPPFFGPYWPVLIIAWGVWLLVRPVFRKRGRSKDSFRPFKDEHKVVVEFGDTDEVYVEDPMEEEEFFDDDDEEDEIVEA